MAASYFTRRLLTSRGITRSAITLQEAAAACREAGSDIIHYAPERDCRFPTGHNFATRDMRATSFPEYGVVCQRK